MTREYVLESEEKLKSVTSIYYLRLYESENINVILGWVPIPLTNEEIKLEIEKKVGKVVRVSTKKHKDGLLSGIRIVTIPKTSLEQNPQPSYVSIHGNELYVTYTGQTVTSRYCQETGHVHCTRQLRETKQDLPQIGNQQIEIYRSNQELETVSDPSMTRRGSYSSDSTKPINLSTRKRTHCTSNLDAVESSQSKHSMQTQSQSRNLLNHQTNEQNNISQQNLIEEISTTLETTLILNNNNPSSLQNSVNWWQITH